MHAAQADAQGTFELSAEALELIAPHYPELDSLQRFIAGEYWRRHGARIEHFARQLLGLKHSDLGWIAGLGYTLPDAEPLFVEQYLDHPVEREIALRLGIPVQRNQVVEVGNLAAVGPGAARRLIVAMTGLLHRMDRTWVVFTSTRSLLNSFARLQIATLPLADADPGRLPDRGRSWGTYYRNHPQVMTANIPLGYVHLAAQGPAPYRTRA
jgi:hypothetical protein